MGATVMMRSLSLMIALCNMDHTGSFVIELTKLASSPLNKSILGCGCVICKSALLFTCAFKSNTNINKIKLPNSCLKRCFIIIIFNTPLKNGIFFLTEFKGKIIKITKRSTKKSDTISIVMIKLNNT